MKKFPVFGIGLGKTGTTSLNEVLLELGWDSIHFPNPDITREILIGEARYNAATDTPIAVNYKVLYERYPGAKFILTTRKLDDWLDSIETHQRTKGKDGHNIPWIANLRQTLYGSATFDRELYSDAFFKHNAEVVNYFFEQSDGTNFNGKLLIIDLTVSYLSDYEKWVKICKFLGEPLPVIDFPHSNKGRYNKLEIIRDNAKKEAYSVQYKKRSVKELTT